MDGRTVELATVAVEIEDGQAAKNAGVALEIEGGRRLENAGVVIGVLLEDGLLNMRRRRIWCSARTQEWHCFVSNFFVGSSRILVKMHDLSYCVGFLR